MTRRTLAILLAVLAAVAGGSAWWIADRESLPARISRPETAVANAEPSELALELPEDGSAAKTIAPTAPTREVARTTPERELQDAWWVEGRVILPPGTPADEHVEVIAVGRKFASRPHHRSPTAADGSFRVAFAPGTGIGWLLLDAKYLYLPTEVTLSPSAQRTGTELRPELGGYVRGRVIVRPEDEDVKKRLVGFLIPIPCSDGGPPHGSLPTHAAQIDANLTFEARGVPAGWHPIDLRLPGAVTESPTTARVGPGEVEDVVVELVPSANVAGIVVDPVGAPIHGALVTAVCNQMLETAASTNPEGRFSLQDVFPGAVTLSARSDGWIVSEPLQIALAPRQIIDEARIVLHRGGRISGRVLDPDGSGWSSARVFLRREDGPLRSQYGAVRSDLECEADRRGRFEFTALASGSYRLDATDGKSRRSAVEFAGASRTGIVLVEGGSVDDIELGLPGFGRVTGRVLGADGQGVGGVLVIARGEDWNLGDDFLRIPRTDRDGRFAIEGLPLGEVSISAIKQTCIASAEAHVIVRADQPAEVEIGLVPGTRLRFRGETNSAAKEPFESMARDESGREWVLYPGWWESPETASDQEYDDPSYGPLPRGRYEIVVTSSNGMTWSGSADLHGEDEMVVLLELDP